VASSKLRAQELLKNHNVLSSTSNQRFARLRFHPHLLSLISLGQAGAAIVVFHLPLVLAKHVPLTSGCVKTGKLSEREVASYSQLSWVFYGENQGDVVVWGRDEAIKEGGKFGAYWIKDKKVVGAFLESGTPDDNKLMASVARKRPTVDSHEELKSGLAFASKI
jgi:hypothetical protein